MEGKNFIHQLTHYQFLKESADVLTRDKTTLHVQWLPEIVSRAITLHTHITWRSVHAKGTQSSEGCNLARTQRQSVLFALAVSLSTPTCGSSILCFPVHFLCLIASPHFPPYFSFNWPFKRPYIVAVHIYICNAAPVQTEQCLLEG